MTTKNKKVSHVLPEDDSLDEMLDKIDLSEKTEMGQVAEEIFKKGSGRSNISDDETGACFKCNVIFDTLGMQEDNPVDMFLELRKSKLGWATEKFVQSTSGMHDQRAGGMFGNLRDKLFTPKG